MSSQPESEYGAEDQSSPCQARACIREQLNASLCSDLDPSIELCPNWNVVNGLLQKLSIAPSPCLARNSTECDPMGRLLLGNLISRDPPLPVVEAALRVFPDSLSHNPVVFFAACQHATPEVVGLMMHHMITQCFQNDNNKSDECPYPWILSGHITVEGAKAMLQVHPQGVLKRSSLLGSLCPLDFFLSSDEMVRQRSFDQTLWQKFKLILVAAESAEQQCDSVHNGISPVHTLVQRILSNPDWLESPKLAQHVLWLLHQLRWTDDWVFEKCCANGEFPLHCVLKYKCTQNPSGLVAARELVKILLEAHPASARYSLYGELPLHMALKNGWPCHDLLLAVFPESLDEQDKTTSMYPFQCAAQQAASPISLDVTFELLKANPTYATLSSVSNMEVGA